MLEILQKLTQNCSFHLFGVFILIKSIMLSVPVESVEVYRKRRIQHQHTTYDGMNCGIWSLSTFNAQYLANDGAVIRYWIWKTLEHTASY